MRESQELAAYPSAPILTSPFQGGRGSYKGLRKQESTAIKHSVHSNESEQVPSHLLSGPFSKIGDPSHIKGARKA